MFITLEDVLRGSEVTFNLHTVNHWETDREGNTIVTLKTGHNIFTNEKGIQKIKRKLEESRTSNQKDR